MARSPRRVDGLELKLRARLRELARVPHRTVGRPDVSVHQLAGHDTPDDCVNRPPCQDALVFVILRRRHEDRAAQQLDLATLVDQHDKGAAGQQDAARQYPATRDDLGFQRPDEPGITHTVVNERAFTDGRRAATHRPPTVTERVHARCGMDVSHVLAAVVEREHDDDVRADRGRAKGAVVIRGKVRAREHGVAAQV